VNPSTFSARIGAAPGSWTRTVAAHGLPSRSSPPDRPLNDAAWRTLLAQCRRQRLTGALTMSIADGTWPATDEQYTAALAAQRSLCGRDLVLERHLLTVLDLLGDAGVDALVLKGTAAAHLLYPDPALRSFRDVDLLIPGEHMGTAVAALVGAGARRRYPEPRPGFDRDFGKGAALVVPGGHEVDLHRTLAQGVYGALVSGDDLRRHRATFVLGDRQVPTLDRTGLALHACLHAVLGSAWPALEDLRDVATALHHPEVDVDDLWARAETWQAESVLCYAIGAAWTELALEEQPEVTDRVRRHRLDARDRRRMAPYLGSRRDTVRMTLGQLAAIEGVRPRAAFLRAVVLPDDALRSRPDRWRRGWRAVRPT
jgi:hypothetical protein